MLKFDKRLSTHTKAKKTPARGTTKARKAIKKVKKTAYKTLKDRAWRVFSLWIRQRGCPTPGREWNKCYTCGKDFLVKNMNAGHFIHGHSKATFFDERNVKCQCVRCNKWLHGNLVEYTRKMIRDYGEEGVLNLQSLSKVTKRWTREELEEIIKKYS